MIKTTKIKDVMTRAPLVIAAEAPLSEAIHLMYSKGINHLPVMKAGGVFGIISDRDTKLAKAVMTADKASVATVGQLCNQEPYLVAEDELLVNVAQAMMSRHIGSALVTCNGKLSGIFTVTDALRTIVAALQS